jgi:amino acid adenylation domain-containing protein
MSTFLPNPSKLASAWLDFLRRPSSLKKSRMSSVQIAPDTPLLQQVAERVHENPEATALVDGEQLFSYRDLESQSNAIASHLEWLGLGVGDLVALVMGRSPNLISAALAAFKIGAAYLPLDPSYPAERLSQILGDATPPVILTASSLPRDFPQGPWKLVDVRKIISAPTGGARKRSPELAPSHLAYVIYTSGSTGRPKGVEITHGNLQNLVRWHLDAFGVSGSDRSTLLASPGFDAAVWEIWPYLAAGATICIVDDILRASPRALRNWMLAKRITISFVPTPVAQRLMFLDWPADCSLRYLLTGADVLHHYPPANLPFALVNNYGPTECTVVATSGILSPDHRPSSRPPIGRPIANTRACVLDEHLQQVPAGTPGELYIAGANVGRGYHNDPKLTAEKFIPNPFEKSSGSRLYKTGDLVRLLPTGELEFLGRTDDQIKIRGHRIEPDEISIAICKHPAIHSTVVIPHTNHSSEPYLVAYLTLNAGQHVSAGELREHLRAHIPDYMIPNSYVVLNSFPVTPNGKVDRSALPAPNSSNILHDAVSAAIASETEKKVGDIISTLLKVDRVDSNDNFFLLGGHSLLGAQLLTEIHNRFHLELSLRSLFDHPTVAAISAEIDRALEVHRNAQL